MNRRPRSAAVLLLALFLSVASFPGAVFAEERTDLTVYEILQDIEGPHHRAWFVRNDGTGDAPTIQAAVDSAAAGDYVVLADGVFTGPGNRDVDFLGKAITVVSESGSPARTVIQCDGQQGYHRGFVFRSGEGGGSRLAGVSIRGGAIPYGGAVLCTLASSPTFVAVEFHQNFAFEHGGGVFCDSLSAPTILHCRFLGNRAMGGAGLSARYSYPAEVVVHDVEFSKNLGIGEYSGGGAIEFYRTRARVTNCRFSQNEAVFGGAVIVGGSYHEQWPATFRNCVFEENSCATMGGAISVWTYALVTLERCTFLGNEAALGAALDLDNGAAGLDANECLFLANEGEYSIIYNLSTSTEVTKRFRNCTFVDNSSGAIGGLIWHESGDRPLVLENTLVAYNHSPSVVFCGGGGGDAPAFSCSDLYGNSGDEWAGCIADQAGTDGNFSADPLFCDTAAADFALSGASPCVDAAGCGQVGAFGSGCRSLAAVGVDAADLPLGTPLIAPNAPNPFNPTTVISYFLPAATHVSLTIHDARGRIVRVLLDEDRPAGPGEVAWNGKDRAGNPAPSGVYFARIAIDGRAETRKMLLIR